MIPDPTLSTLPPSPGTGHAVPETRNRAQSIAPEMANWGDQLADPNVHISLPLDVSAAEVTVDVQPHAHTPQELTASTPDVGNRLACAAVSAGLVIGGGLIALLLYYNVQAEP